MGDLVYTELLKLKRSSMFLISMLGAMVAPFMIVVAAHVQTSGPRADFRELFYQTNLYTVLVLGVALYGVVAAYLFHREYVEDTLKHILTIPVSRGNFIISKFAVLLLWIMILTGIAWLLTLLLGILFRFDGLSWNLLVFSFKQFYVGGLFLFILSPPVVFVTLVMKNYVPPIILAIVITMMNVMAGNSEHRGLFPWSAAGDIANHTLLDTYPAAYSYSAIAAVAILGFGAVMLYFQKTDIQ
ncbi:ABC transporter permease [Ectobacillus sp. JY-23]|uniref:ABC transporter permease n=1 Tax=Ectobacillus sp. JY-23 TaxID=2933872 RepID=UPI001FF19E52|nr:ABC transporter permease [Ectobacillus sp. JY-23]UOY91531.1 ABC transporter permease [Ectobacillus sp. JY-23]